MKYQLGDSELTKVYEQVGRLTYNHNALEAAIADISIALFPMHLRDWKLATLEWNFSKKVDALEKLAKHHGLIERKHTKEIQRLTDASRLLAKQRNTLIHAVERLSLDLSDQNGAQANINLLIEFYSDEKKLDTSVDSLVEINESYDRILEQIYLCKEQIEGFLAGNLGYPEHNEK